MNKSSTIDAAMLVRKFYCHKCGNKLKNNPHTRTVSRKDPEYKNVSQVGHMHLIGDVEFTKYNFKCHNCNCIIAPEEQYIIERIQKMLGKHILNEEELSQNREIARLSIERKNKITNIIVKTIYVIAIIVVLFLFIKTGSFSFSFYF